MVTDHLQVLGGNGRLSENELINVENEIHISNTIYRCFSGNGRLLENELINV